MTIAIADVFHAITETLDRRFPTIKIYGEEIKQGLVPPSFFVKSMLDSQSKEVGRRYLRRHAYDIHYFGQTNHELRAMAEQLYDIMEYILINGKVFRGSKMQHEIIDGVLHFYVDYDFHVMRQKEVIPKMNTLEGGLYE